MTQGAVMPHPFERAVEELANLWRRGSEPESLITRVDEMIARARSAEDPDAEAVALMMKGRLLRALDRPAQASEALVAAFEINQRREQGVGLVMTVVEIAQLTLDTGRADALPPLMKMAREIMRSADPTGQEFPMLGAAVHQLEALSAMDGGDGATARQDVEKALKLMARHERPHDVGYRALKSNVIGTLAMLEAQSGRWVDAERQARRAAMLLDPSSYPSELAQLRRVQAMALRRMGRLQEAETRQREVVEQFARLHRRSEQVEATAELSRILDEQGRAEEAEALLGEAMSMMDAAVESRTRAEALHVAGLVRASAGDAGGAEALLETAAQMREQLGDEGGLSDSLRALAALRSRAGDDSMARAQLDTALEAAGDRALPRARTLLDLARHPGTELEEGITALMEAERITQGSDEALLRVEILIELAERMVAAGRVRQASDIWLTLEQLIEAEDPAASVRAALYTAKRRAMTGQHQEGLRLCNASLETLDAAEAQPRKLRGLRSRALHLGGKICGIAGILTESERWLSRAREAASDEGDARFEAEVLSDLAQLALIQEQSEAGEALGREGMRVASEEPESREYLQCLRAVGIALSRQGRFEEAHAALDRYAIACRKRGEGRLEAEALADLAELFVERNPDYARRLGANGLSVAQEARHDNASGRCRVVLARLWLERNSPARAQTLLEQAVADFSNAGDPLGQGSALYLLGQTLVMQGNTGGGLELLQRALGIVQSRGLTGPAQEISQSIKMLLKWQADGH